MTYFFPISYQNPTVCPLSVCSKEVFDYPLLLTQNNMYPCRDGRLTVGDEIVNVNCQRLRGLSMASGIDRPLNLRPLTLTILSQNLSAQFVFPSPKILDFNEKKYSLDVRSPCVVRKFLITLYYSLKISLQGWSANRR